MSHIVTPKFRVSFPAVFEAKYNKLSKRDEYSVQALFAKGEDLSVLKEAVKQAAIKKWGPDRAKWPKLRLPFRDQGDREKTIDGKSVLPEGYEKGAVYLNLRTTNRPKVVDQNRQEILNTEDFYAGCYARAAVSCYAYDTGGNAGVAFGLNHIQKVADGESFSGRPRVEECFTPIAGADGGSSAAGISDEDLFD